MSTQKKSVAVVGATGLAGQQFLAALASHPFFEITQLAASARSAGKTYRQAITDGGQLRWYADSPMPAAIADLTVDNAETLDARQVDLVFSCVESGAAKTLEPLYAEHAPVISTASAYRYDDDVPLLLPGCNPDHVSLLDEQRKRRGWKGFIAPNPNCTTVGLAISLAPLHKAFGVRRVFMTSMQAVSGAGRSPGVIALDVVDNIIPFIPGEEEKVEAETRKVLGTLATSAIEPAAFRVSCTCTRVAVLEGHTESVFVELATPATDREIRDAWREHGADIDAADHPSAPDALIQVVDDPYRPQVRLDRDNGNGMTTTVGRLRKDEAVGNGWKYLLVSHNTKMGQPPAVFSSPSSSVR